MNEPDFRSGCSVCKQFSESDLAASAKKIKRIARGCTSFSQYQLDLVTMAALARGSLGSNSARVPQRVKSSVEEHARNIAVDSMSIKELKTEMKQRGIDYSDCFEKSELKQRLKDANDGKRVPRVAKGGVSQADVARRAAAAHLKSGDKESSRRREYTKC